MSSTRNPQVYVGGLSRRTRTEDLEKAFGKYGKIRDISIKGKYAFVEYDDYHAARDAVDRMDGKTVDGERLSVEPTKGRGRRGPSPNDKCWQCGKSGHWANECRDSRRRSNSRDKMRKEGRCYKCGRRGHKQRDCSMSRSRSRSRDRRRSRGSRSRSSSYSRSHSRDRRDRRHHRRSYSPKRDRGGRSERDRGDRSERARDVSRSRTPERERRRGGKSRSRSYTPRSASKSSRGASRSPSPRSATSKSKSPIREPSRSKSPRAKSVEKANGNGGSPKETSGDAAKVNAEDGNI